MSEIPFQSGWLYNPVFAGDWKQASLYELAGWTNGLAFRDVHFSGVGRPVIKIAEIKNGITAQTGFTEQEFDSAIFITSGDMLFSWSGSPETSIDVFWWHGVSGWLNQHIFKVIPGPEVDRTFFYYILRYLNPQFVSIAKNKQTTGLGHVTIKDLKAMRVSIPSRDEQKSIADVLGALDDKIELNRRMNETLESMARALFQSWFVDFDPVRARMEGRQTFGMDVETAVLFPCAFTDSAFGEIPQGWNVGTIRELCQRVENGGTPSRNVADYWHPAEINWLTSGEVRQGIIIATENFISLEGLKRSSAKLWPCGTTVVALYGATAGQACYLAIETSANQACCGLMPKQDARCYLYFAVSHDVTDLEQQARGSAQQNLSQDIVNCHRVLLPSQKVLSAFERTITPLMQEEVANLNESRTLATIRDTLLPKLMSGEVRVRNAEKMVEDNLSR